MEGHDALQLGRDAWKEDSVIGVDVFRALDAKPGLQKLFLRGFLEGLRLRAGGKHVSHDKVSLFETERIQQLVREVFPRDLTKTGRLRTQRSADGSLVATDGALRPEQFGRYLQAKKAEIETRDTVLRGSQTDRNIEKGKEFDIMSRWEEIRQTAGSMPMLAVKSASYLLEKLFGMRTDAAGAAVRMLFNADPAKRARAIYAIEQRMGKSRMEHFTKLMEEHQRLLVSAGARQSAMPDIEQ